MRAWRCRCQAGNGTSWHSAARSCLVILDEPSMGLAPLMVDKVYDTLSELQSRGVAVVVIEQIATHAVEHADQLFLLSRGRVVYSGKPTEQTVADAIKASYVGAAA